MSCGVAPLAPDPLKTMQRETAEYLPKLYAWGLNCKNTLDAARAYLVKEKANIESVN